MACCNAFAGGILYKTEMLEHFISLQFERLFRGVSAQCYEQVICMCLSRLLSDRETNQNTIKKQTQQILDHSF